MDALPADLRARVPEQIMIEMENLWLVEEAHFWGRRFTMSNE